MNFQPSPTPPTPSPKPAEFKPPAHHHAVAGTAPWQFFPGQLDYLSRVATKDAACIPAATGTGKSLMSIALLRLKHEAGPGQPFKGRALVIAPQGTVRSMDDDEGDDDAAADADDPKDNCILSQWAQEFARFAPGVPVWNLMGFDDYHALIDRYGTLPDGVYLTYYEALFKNGARERLPETMTHAKLCHAMGIPMGPTYRQFLMDWSGGGDLEWHHEKNFPGLDLSSVAIGSKLGAGTVLKIAEHPLNNYCDGVGQEKSGILCLAAPSLATGIETDHPGRERALRAAADPDWRPANCVFDSVVLDEAHVICNLGAQITQAVIRLRARHRWAVTATPIPNLLTNLFPIMGWLCVPDWFLGARRNAAFPYAREDLGTFSATFLSEERDYTQEQRNEESARARSKRWSGKCVKVSPVISAPARLLKVLKPSLAYLSMEDCNPAVVPCRTYDVRVPMGREQAALYEHFANRQNVPGKNARVRASNQLTYLRGVCADPKGLSAKARQRGMACPVVRSNFNPKIVAALDIIYDCLDKGESVTVVSARHGQTDELYFRLAATIGEHRLSRIDSTVLARRHTEESARFKAGQARVNFMGIKCAKAYSFAHCPNLIILSMEYSLGTLAQARGRVWRANSRGSRWLADDLAERNPHVRVWCLLHKGTIEETMFDIVATKQDAATICLLGRRVPREFKPVDMEEVLTESLSRREEELDRITLGLINGTPAERPDMPLETEQESRWPAMAARLTSVGNAPAWLKAKAYQKQVDATISSQPATRNYP